MNTFHVRTPRLVIALVAALATAFAVAPAAAFHADDVPLVASYPGPGSASYAVKLEHGGGDFAFDLVATAPATGQELSAGAYFFDANRNLVFGFAFTGHTSPDRIVLSPAGTAGDAAAAPAWLTVEASTASTDARCTFMCLGLEGRDAPAGVSYYMLWMGAATSTLLEVRGEDARATVNVGAAYVLGDADIATGAPNAQVQQSVPPTVKEATLAGVGLKVMKDASVTVEAKHALWGFWGASDFKLACNGYAGVCMWRSSAAYACADATGLDCETTKISYSGPTGRHAGYQTYALNGAPAGSYTFTVDEKVDAYTAGYVYNDLLATFVLINEDYSYLTIADNELPA